MSGGHGGQQKELKEVPGGGKLPKAAMAEKRRITGKQPMPVNAKCGKTAKAKAKYKNPDDKTQTWSGRGRQPAWFKAAIESGKSPEELSV